MSEEIKYPTVPVSIGELYDKISILLIKTEKIEDPEKLNNIHNELDQLLKVAVQFQIDPRDFDELKAINLRLWQIEDEMRAAERDGLFGSRFVETMRGNYNINDLRAKKKREINLKYESGIVEEKSYKEL